MAVESELDDSSDLSPRAVIHNHYTQSKGSNGNGNSQASRTNTILLGCLIAIIGFVGAQVWRMSGDVESVKTTLQLIVDGKIRLPVATP